MRFRSSCMCWAFLLLCCAQSALYGQTSGRVIARVVTAAGDDSSGVEADLVPSGGRKPLATARTDAGGRLVFVGVPPGQYDLRIGDRALSKSIRVFAARETDLGTLAVNRTSSDSSDKDPERTNQPLAAAEVSTVITTQQVEQLPVLGRNPIQLVGTVAGANSNTRSSVAVNGLRPAYAAVSLDGVNIMDQFLRSVDAPAARPVVDQISEIAILTSNQPASYGIGTAQVMMATPSGSNQYHGSLYWQNRNSLFAANNWFNNKDRVERPFLNRNQVGGSLGGPVLPGLKDRLLFYTNYEGIRTRQQTRANRTILTSDARRGIYTYLDAAGAVRKFDFAQLSGFQLDPVTQQLIQMTPGPENINNVERGDSRPGLTRNTAGYSFNVRADSDTDQFSQKIDWHVKPGLRLGGSYYLQRSSSDQPNFSNDFSTVPRNAGVIDADVVSLSAGWSLTPAWNIEARAGRIEYSNLTTTSQVFPDRIFVLPLGLSNPINTVPAVGRYGNTRNLAASTTHVAGHHVWQAGFQWQRSWVNPFDEFNIRPTCGIGTGAGNFSLPLTVLPGLPAQELSAVNGLLALHGGFITNCGQAFNAQSRTSGFVPLQPFSREMIWNTSASFLQDRWNVHPRLTLSLGVRYEAPAVIDEPDSLLLFPIIDESGPVGTLRSNLKLDFSGSSAGRLPYRKDRNNFAPQAGLTFRADSSGSTMVRAGYSVHYLEDASSPMIQSGLVNEGLRRPVNVAGSASRAGVNPPIVPAPQLQIPLTLADNYRLNVFQSVVLPDPDLRTPYVHQWTAGVERRLPFGVLEGRYVGNHAVGLLRGLDVNPIDIRSNGFLADFQRAVQNGRLAQAAGGAFNPAYNPQISGSQPLTVFPQLPLGGGLTSPIIQSFLLTDQPAGLAYLYTFNRLNGPVSFFPNPNAVSTWLLTNNDHSAYHAMQLEFRTQGASHFLAANYSFSKALSTSAGISSNRLEPFLDLSNQKLDRARPLFDQTHALKIVGSLNLPFGRGRWLNYAPLEFLLSGWNLSGIVLVQSGAPFSILSGRETFNQMPSSANNPANSLLTRAELDEIVGFRQTDAGPSIIAASAIGPDGRGSVPDNRAPFPGQVFSHPLAGQIGGLQRRMFNGPAHVTTIAALGKTIRIREQQSMDLRVEALNVLNRPNWTVLDQDIGSPTFGRISAASDGRIVQFNLHYRF